jgi:transposase-like protein
VNFNLKKGGISERKKKSYTEEFKAKAVKLMTVHGYKVSEAARNPDIYASLLRRWKNSAEASQAS